VASGLLAGLFPLSKADEIAVMVQPSVFDSLEPTYSCNAASNLRSDYTTGKFGATWQTHISQAAPIYAQLDGISGIAPQDAAGWHSSFDQYVARAYLYAEFLQPFKTNSSYYDNLSAKQCHGKALPCSVNDTSVCVSQELVSTKLLGSVSS